MRRNRSTLVGAVALALAFLTTLATAQMPPASAEAREKMGALARLVGEWQGEAHMQTGRDTRQVVAQHELVEWAAGGEALLIRGVGTIQGRVVHDAIAVILWDGSAGRYAMWTYRAGSGPLAPEISVSSDGYSWSFASPGSDIRFVQHFDEAGRWVEIGERSPDHGETWYAFFDMALTKR